jgi:hypothetical protein
MEYDFFYTRKAFTVEEEEEIIRMYDAGRGKSLEVNAKLSGLPVVISLFKDGKQKRDEFNDLLAFLETKHILVKWTKTYYVVTVAPQVAVTLLSS